MDYFTSEGKVYPFRIMNHPNIMVVRIAGQLRDGTILYYNYDFTVHGDKNLDFVSNPYEATGFNFKNEIVPYLKSKNFDIDELENFMDSLVVFAPNTFYSTKWNYDFQEFFKALYAQPKQEVEETPSEQ